MGSDHSWDDRSAKAEQENLVTSNNTACLEMALNVSCLNCAIQPVDSRLVCALTDSAVDHEHLVVRARADCERNRSSSSYDDRDR
jgi:hypothetical protein